jgi:hypothetical protein
MDFPMTPSRSVPEQDPLLEPMDYSPVTAASSTPPNPQPVAAMALSSAVIRNGNGGENTRTKVEMMRLEGLVKKLQVELQAEREYCRALEAHIRTLQEAD